MNPDRLIELFLSGATAAKAAQAMGQPVLALQAILNAYAHNTEGCLERYQPKARASRRNKPFTKNELKLLTAWRKRKLPVAAQARFLCRDLHEFALDAKDLERLYDLRRVGTGVDLVWAYRYLYYVRHISILSDQAYDDLEKEELEFGASGDLLKAPGSDREEDYPPHIRSLALYLVFKYCRKQETKL